MLESSAAGGQAQGGDMALLSVDEGRGQGHCRATGDFGGRPFELLRELQCVLGSR